MKRVTGLPLELIEGKWDDMLAIILQVLFHICAFVFALALFF